MRIAYITIHIAPEIMHGGVGKKIKTQTDIWSEYGHEVVIFNLTPQEIKPGNARQFIFNTNSGLLKREFGRTSALKRMITSIRQWNPDMIYLRYGLYAYPLHHIFRIAPVFLEINSNDKDEYKSRGKFLYWMNRMTRNLIFGPSAGIVSPTSELTHILSLGNKKPSTVISNGIDFNTVSILPPTKNTSPVITMVASPGMNWHGVDKLIDLAKMHPDLHINIVGYSANDMKMPIPANVTLHGFLNRTQIHEVYKFTDVACGTLALHRKGMEEACALKVREALEFGIPMLIGYSDPDLAQVTLDTILKIKNYENNILENHETIYRFAWDMIGRRVDVDQIYPYLDQRKKEENRLSFFKQVLDTPGSL